MSPALATLFRLVPPPIALKLPSAFFVNAAGAVALSKVKLSLFGLLGSVASLSYLTANSSVACCASFTIFNCSSVAARPCVAKSLADKFVLLRPSNVPLVASNASVFVPLLTWTLPSPIVVTLLPSVTVKPSLFKTVLSVPVPAVTLSKFASFFMLTVTVVLPVVASCATSVVKFEVS